jgi:hypothetical protein
MKVTRCDRYGGENMVRKSYDVPFHYDVRLPYEGGFTDADLCSKCFGELKRLIREFLQR